MSHGYKQDVNLVWTITAASDTLRLIKLKPHTDEWFTAFEAQSPTQAAMVRGTVEQNSIWGCSICGEQPSQVCSPRSFEGPFSLMALRLCAECHEIRQSEFDERWSPSAVR